MEWKTPRWFGATDRHAQLDDHIDRTDVAHFGHRQMPTAEKVDWVRRHFNRVAPKYDLMNTLLSFGIQYAWKRTAIRMMGLSGGDRVLDVCGGTAVVHHLKRRLEILIEQNGGPIHKKYDRVDRKNMPSDKRY